MLLVPLFVLYEVACHSATYLLISPSLHCPGNDRLRFPGEMIKGIRINCLKTLVAPQANNKRASTRHGAEIKMKNKWRWPDIKINICDGDHDQYKGSLVTLAPPTPVASAIDQAIQNRVIIQLINSNRSLLSKWKIEISFFYCPLLPSVQWTWNSIG